MLAKGKVTLLFGAHDIQHNNAVALADYLAENKCLIRTLMVQSCPATGGMRYGPRSSRVRHDDRGGPSSDTK